MWGPQSKLDQTPMYQSGSLSKIETLIKQIYGK